MADNASVTKIAGLFRSPNPLSSTPLGALKKAKNCVINFKDVLEPRRGLDRLREIVDPDELFAYQGHILAQYGDKLAYDSGVAMVDYSGTNAPRDASVERMKSVEVANNFYYTTSEGVKLLDAFDAEPELAGLPRGPTCTTRNTQLGLNGNPGDGWLDPDVQVGYCAVYGIRDANDNVKLGEPSETLYLSNAANATIAIGDAALQSFTANVELFVPDAWADVISAGDIISVTFDPADPFFLTGTFTVTSTGTSLGRRYVIYNQGFAAGDVNNTVACTAISGTKNVLVPVNLSAEATTDMFVQIYRTKNSVAADAPPNADFYLVNERQLSAGDIAAGGYSITDTTPEALLLSPAYFNVNVGGEAPDSSPDNDNQRPPVTLDVATWDDRMWGANYVERHNLVISLFGVGAPDGLQVGDTITIDGITFSGIAEGAAAGPDEFHVYSSSDFPSVNTFRTALSLTLAVTKSTSGSTVNAYYTSSNEEPPGELFLEQQEAAAGAFTVTVSRASAWSPDPTGGLTSTADAATNGLWFSKQGQPEAVPRLNRLSVGPRNASILRIKPLGERIYVFTNKSIYTVAGQYPYRVDLVSKTAILLAPDTLVDFDDALYGLTTQGASRISDAGVGVISSPIEVDIKQFFGAALPVLRVKATAVGYESYRKYILSMPEDPSDTENSQCFVYDVATQAWTQWDRSLRCLVMEPLTDVLHAGSDDGWIVKERKTFTRWDYVDESFAVSVTAFSGKVVTLTDASAVLAGDLLYQSPTCHAVVTAVSGNDVTVKTTELWTVGLDTLCYKGIDNEFAFVENHGGNPEITKKWPAVTYHWRNPSFSAGVAYVASENTPADAVIPVAIDAPGWGGANWGAFPWASPASPKNQRIVVGRQGSYLTVGFRIREALATWASYGYTPEMEPLSERNSR